MGVSAIWPFHLCLESGRAHLGLLSDSVVRGKCRFHVTISNLVHTVVPAKAGVQNISENLDFGLHPNDDRSIGAFMR